MMRIAFRRLRRHWRLNLALMVCLILSSALLTAPSIQLGAVTWRELDRILNDAKPADRSLLITGNRYTFHEDYYEDLARRLGDLLEDRLVIRYSSVQPDLQPEPDEPGRKRPIARLELYSFDGLSESVRLIGGTWPARIRLNGSVGYWPPPVEVVVGRQAAEQSGYAIGDRVTATHRYHRLDIVGIVEPLDPEADLWGDDLSAFAVALGIQDPEEKAITLPLIMAPESMRSYLAAPVFPHEISWRITLDRRHLAPNRAEILHSDLMNFQTQSATRGATVTTGLVQILAGFAASRSRVRLALWSMVIPDWIPVLCALILLSSSSADRSRVEFGTLSARGMSVWRIVRFFAPQYLIVALPAALLGPILAHILVWLWSGGTGMLQPGGFSGEMWLMSGSAAAAGWLTLAVSAALTARRAAQRPETWRPGPPHGSVLQRRTIDLYLLAFGGLLTWQLNRSGSLLLRVIAGSRSGDTPLADPLLLLGPFLVLVAMALAFLRVVPVLIGLLARPFQRLRGPLLSLGFIRPAGDAAPASRLVLLLSLSTGSALFSLMIAASMAQGELELRPDTVMQEVASAFLMNTVILLLFSVATSFTAALIDVPGHGRAYESAIMRSMGLPPDRWRISSVIEGIVVLFLGLLAGNTVGLGLSYAIIPFLSDTLLASIGQSEGNAMLGHAFLGWRAILNLNCVLVALHALTTAVLWQALGRSSVHRPMKMQDE